MSENKATAPYIWHKTFFQHNRWDAHALVGELLARGITQVAIALVGADWIVSWPERVPPDVVKTALETDPA